jgi:hypothetical protein
MATRVTKVGPEELNRTALLRATAPLGSAEPPAWTDHWDLAQVQVALATQWGELGAVAALL